MHPERRQEIKLEQVTFVMYKLEMIFMKEQDPKILNALQGCFNDLYLHSLRIATGISY
jgi:hypothetical protein